MKKIIIIGLILFSFFPIAKAQDNELKLAQNVIDIGNKTDLERAKLDTDYIQFLLIEGLKAVRHDCLIHFRFRQAHELKLKIKRLSKK